MAEEREEEKESDSEVVVVRMKAVLSARIAILSTWKRKAAPSVVATGPVSQSTRNSRKKSAGK